MRSLVAMGGLVLVLVLGSAAEASNYRCRLGDPCWYCSAGSKLDDCSVTCNVCTGIRCLGASSVAEAEFADLAAEKDLASTGPLQALLRFPSERLGELVHPSVAVVYGSFWRWRDAPLHSSHAHQDLDLAGGVTIDGKPREFTLSVRQQGDSQLHLLRIESIGSVVLTVQPAEDGRHIVEFDTYPEGPERGRSGFLRSETVQPAEPR